jgi:hypothetical protein
MRSRYLTAFLAAAIVAAAVGGCGSGEAQESALIPGPGAYRGSEPPGHIPMPAFELSDSHHWRATQLDVPRSAA